MNKWQDMFKIHRADDGPMFRSTWYVLYISTGLPATGKYRRYGYSYEIDAKRGAAQMFNAYKRSIEKDLLG